MKIPDKINCRATWWGFANAIYDKFETSFHLYAADSQSPFLKAQRWLDTLIYEQPVLPEEAKRAIHHGLRMMILDYELWLEYHPVDGTYGNIFLTNYAFPVCWSEKQGRELEGHAWLETETIIETGLWRDTCRHCGIHRDQSARADGKDGIPRHILYWNEPMVQEFQEGRPILKPEYYGGPNTMMNEHYYQMTGREFQEH